MTNDTYFNRRMKETCVGVGVYLDRKLVLIASGFVIEFMCEWHWATAAHVFDEIDQQIRDRDYSLKFLPLEGSTDPTFFSYTQGMPFRFDHLGRNALSKVPHMPHQAREIFEMAVKSDVAMLRLSELDRRLLISYGIKPVPERDALGLTDEEASSINPHEWQFFLAGIPRERVLVAPDDRDSRYAFLTLPIATLPASDSMTSQERFLRDYPPDLHLAPDWPPELFDGDVMGMSGGPVFGVRGKTVRLAGMLVARTGWERRRPKSLRIAACDVLLALRRELQERGILA